MKIMIFIGDGVIGHVTLNRLIPDMMNMGVEPVIVKTQSSTLEKANIPELKALSFLESALLSNVVEPFLEKSNQDNKAAPLNLPLPLLAQKYDLDVREISDVNSKEFIESVIADEEIIGGISTRSYPIFQKEIINVFNEKGFMWNLHTGLLPKYKGVFIPYHAIANGEQEYGWTLHEIVPDIDLGNIIATDTVPLDPNKPVLDTYLSMTDKGASMVMGALMHFKEKEFIPSKNQITMLDSYYTFPTAQEMASFDEKQIRFAGDIADTYAGLFTISGSLEETQLRQKINSEVAVLQLAPATKSAGHHPDFRVA